MKASISKPFIIKTLVWLLAFEAATQCGQSHEQSESDRPIPIGDFTNTVELYNFILRANNPSQGYKQEITYENPSQGYKQEITYEKMLTAHIVANATEDGAVYITSQQVDEITKAYRNVTAWYDTQIKEASVKPKRGPRFIREMKLLMTCASVLKGHFKSFTSPFDLERLLIFPGTKWCGRGNIAGHEEDLGRFRGTDMCCREHDQAVDFIKPLSGKYGIKNTRLWPMTNCDDDKKFYNCLLSDDSESSVMSACVGTIYFNVLSAECFKQAYPVTCVDYKTMVLQTGCRRFMFDTSRSTWQTLRPNSFLDAYLRKH